MKKIALPLAAIALLLALSPMAVFAGAPSPPNYGKVDPVGLWPPPPYPPLSVLTDVEKVLPSKAPDGQSRIINDPLVPTGQGSSASGWVIFWCQSQMGFQYNIGATGLNPLSTYSVHAVGVKAQIVTSDTPGAEYVPGEDIWIKIVGFPDLDLGKLRTDANGSGGVKGVTQLEGVYLYIVSTVVRDSIGNTALATPEDDPNAFLVYR